MAAIASFYTFRADEAPALGSPALSRSHALRERQRLPRPVPEADRHQFFAVITDAHERAMFLLTLRCGLRIAAVAALVGEAEAGRRDAQRVAGAAERQAAQFADPRAVHFDNTTGL